MTNTVLDGKSHAGNPHVWIDEEGSASAKPMCSSPRLMAMIRNAFKFAMAAGVMTLVGQAFADTPNEAGDPLRMRYQLLDSIESSKSQYIDTGVVGQTGLEADLDMTFVKVNSSDTLPFASRKGNNRFYFLVTSGSKVGFRLGTASAVLPLTYTAGTRYQIRSVIHTNERTFSANGTELSRQTTSVSALNSGLNLFLFACNQDGSPTYKSDNRLYRATISQGGTVLRDFVPARRIYDGKVGLLDLAHLNTVDEFYANKASGTDFTAGTVTNILQTGTSCGAMLDYLKNTNGKLSYVDSGYHVKTNSYVTLDVKINDGTISRAFGAFAKGTNEMGMVLYVWNDNNKYRVRIGDGGNYPTQTGTVRDFVRHTHTLDALKGEYWLDSTKQISTGLGFYTADTQPSTYPLGFFFYSGYNGDINFLNSQTIYGVKCYEYDTAETKSLVSDFVPWRSYDGKTGFFDLVKGEFHPYASQYVKTGGAKATAYALTSGPLAYVQNPQSPTTLFAFDGTLGADHLTTTYMKRFESISAVEKTTVGTLAAGAVTSYAMPLTLGAGVFSLADGAVKTVTVDGVLTFKGGATLAIDANATACDSFAVQSLVLADMTAENPLVIDIANEGMYTDWSQGLTLVAGAGLDEGIRTDIRVVQKGPEDLVAAVVDGDLVIIVAPSAVAYWKGPADGDLADPANWAYTNINGVAEAKVPDADTVVYFTGAVLPDVPVGASLVAKKIIMKTALSADCDWRGLSLPLSGKLDLNGHNLTVSQLLGTNDCEITDSTVAYEVLESIEATGTQYIDTGYVLKEKDVVDLQATIPSNQSQFLRFFGANNGAANRYEVGINNGGNASPGTVNAICRYWRAKANDGNKTTDKNFYGQPIVIHCDETCMTWKPVSAVEWSETIPVVGGLSGDCDKSCYILTSNGSTSGKCKATLYSFRITSNGAVVRNFVPAKRLSDGAIGLLDLANWGLNEFYANAGTGTFTAGAATGERIANGGELHIDVASGTTCANTTVTLSGTLRLVKDGEGTFSWDGGTFATATSSSILVTNGVFKLGVTTANVFGSMGTIQVAEVGQFNLNYGVANGTSPVINKTFLIEGDGPDGSGALVNNVQAGAWGYHLASVYLTGDATIGGTGRIDFRSGSLNGNGYTLTCKNTDMLCFAGGVLRGCQDFVLADKGVVQPCATGAIDGIDGAVILKHGGIFASWASSGTAVTHAVPVVVGEGGGGLRSDSGTGTFSGTLTVNAGETLTLGTDNSCLLTGTLAGGGAIVDTTGTLVFSGDTNCWKMTTRAGKVIERVNLDNAPTNFLANLKKIDVTNIKGGGSYNLCPLLGLTAETVEQIELVVTDSSTGRPIKDCQLEVRGGRLYLSIPSGLLLIVR